jgi:hypothetical protein
VLLDLGSGARRVGRPGLLRVLNQKNVYLADAGASGDAAVVPGTDGKID